MSKTDWRSPFRKFRDRIRVLYDANQQIYHSVLMTPFHSGEQSSDVVNEMEPVYEGHGLLSEIPIPTDGRGHHAHYFFGDNGAFQQLGRELNGVRGWIQSIPKQLLSEFDVPRLPNQTDENIVYWTNLVYQVAWKIDAPYLQATVEFRPDHAGGAFLPWDACSQPLDIDPRPLLFQYGNPTVRFGQWPAKFETDQRQPPEVIDAYLCAEESIVGEFLYCSLTAIDALIYIVELKQAEKTYTEQNPIRRNRNKKNTPIHRDIAILFDFLRMHHFVDIVDKEKGDPMKPLTQTEIAVALEWFLPNGNPDQVKVTRRMKSLFGQRPMEQYHAILNSESPVDGFIKARTNGGNDVEAIVDEDEDD